MPRKAEGDRPLTAAERQARQRERRAEQAQAMRKALEQITLVRTVQQARKIAAAALGVGE